MPENILILADWRLAGIVDDTMPPRDPNGDDDEEEEDEEEDEERNDQGLLPRSRSTAPSAYHQPDGRSLEQA
jgi:hypothetical protein